MTTPSRMRDERHLRMRRVFRVVGPILLLAGITLVAIAFVTVIAGDPFEHPLRAGLSFAGMPLMFIGGVMTSMGYMGALARYQAGEVLPVAGDSFNQFADDVQPGVRAVAGAISAGIQAESAAMSRDCVRCGRGNEADASFCDQCGEMLPTSRSCPACGKRSEADAHYCADCGQRL